VAFTADYFNINCRDIAMIYLRGIALKTLDMYYLGLSGKASSSPISGILLLGDLELDLYHRYVSSLATDGPTASGQA
jgi:hypothetical protein